MNEECEDRAATPEDTATCDTNTTDGRIAALKKIEESIPAFKELARSMNEEEWVALAKTLHKILT